MVTQNDPAPLLLRPGALLLRRDRSSWQLGLDRSVAARVPAPRDGSRPATVPVDTATHGIAAAEAAATVQRDPDRAEDRLRARAAGRVEVRDHLGLDAAGLLRGAGTTVGDRPDVVLVLCDGEAERDPLDRLVRAGVPHLLVRLVDGVVTVGPFVVPGRTACVRCVDEHLAAGDPAHHSLVAQHARLSRHPVEQSPGYVAPRDHALLTLATAWAVRDVLTHLEGDRPTTWSATVRLEAGLAAVTEVRWLRHPECGCVWLPDEDVSATLEA
ncbi:MAG TPA: TOMM precursor leader peptide-binding protein [Marmoricola sp.]|nr:TOMM precursor leader peptide-binding protein [Marmoricola sp.]